MCQDLEQDFHEVDECYWYNTTTCDGIDHEILIYKNNNDIEPPDKTLARNILNVLRITG